MPAAASPNFFFLAHHDPRLVVLGTQAERYFAEDPNTCLVKLRQFGEILAQRAAARLGLYASPEDNQATLINRLRERGALDVTTRQLFHDLRVAGNKATHEIRGDHREALHQLKMARELAVWFQRSFGNDRKFDPGPFVPPPDPAKEDAALATELERLRAELARSKVDIEAVRAAAEEEAKKRLTAEERARKESEDRAILEALATEVEQKWAKDVKAFERQKAQLAAELAALQEQAAAAPPAAIQAVVERAAEAAQAIHLDEAATRRIIDAQLRNAGWEADSEHLDYRRGTRPQKGKNLAIAEWPTETGPVDYALFVGLEAFAVVEAKKMSVDVANVLKQQTVRYSRGLTLEGEARFAGGPWDKGHRVPFLFATNGRAYLKQIETKSGIWFRDARRSTNLARPLEGWYTPEGLVALFKQDIAAAHARLDSEPTGYLDLRDYQIRAIRAVETAIEGGQRACLVAMATGTGKTRTAIGLVYRLIKAQRFRRILFLVDRSALGEQTVDALKDVRLENLQTFAEIYNIKGLEDARPDAGTKLHVATIQGMVKRVLLSKEEEEKKEADVPPVDQYDCIVVDECHRGYTLDQEMSDVELRFRSDDDYVSRYRRVLDHFDAVKIGLTATPAAHTKEIFGDPVFLYSYREAVIDGCLVDHEPPVTIVTELARKGMIWKQGETMRLFNPRTAAEELVDVKDEVKVDIDGFNSKVITRSFNEAVCAELARHIDPTLPGKTLIFCVNDAHADLVVSLLEVAFHERYGDVDEGTVTKITGHPSVDRPLQLIRHFKNERLPSVAVTVDLLTTGIDVPKICNLVFLRQVKSRILYEQMMGRATRLCPEIEKASFRIFDAVALYENFERLTSMTPVVNDVSLSFEELVKELRTQKDAEVRAPGARPRDAAPARSDAGAAPGAQARARRGGLQRVGAAERVAGQDERRHRRVDHGLHPAGGARRPAGALQRAGGQGVGEDRPEPRVDARAAPLAGAHRQADQGRRGRSGAGGRTRSRHPRQSLPRRARPPGPERRARLRPPRAPPRPARAERQDHQRRRPTPRRRIPASCLFQHHRSREETPCKPPKPSSSAFSRVASSSWCRTTSARTPGSRSSGRRCGATSWCCSRRRIRSRTSWDRSSPLRPSPSRRASRRGS